MENVGEKQRFARPIGARRRSVAIEVADGVRIGPLSAESAIPLVVESDGSRDLIEWVEREKQRLDDELLQHRALLFRGFRIEDAEYLRRFMAAACDGGLLDYVDRSTPRSQVADRIFESTVYPPDQEIKLHNEGTYWVTWPLKICFCCMQPAASGGETPIADTRRIYAAIPEEVRSEFERRDVMYVRNYNQGFGLPWQETFQTEDRAVVEEFCREKAIEYRWIGDDRLQTRQIRPAVRSHPATGESLWFNHAAFFHITSRDEETREALVEAFGEENLPFNTYYGDGGTIPGDAIKAVMDAYERESTTFHWMEGDVLLLDNMTICHGRRPYEGDRKVIVAMAEPMAGDAP